MLISFSVKNWMSFRDEVTFSMVAGSERQHGQRILKHGNKRILPISAIYGGNASGKSNFVNAINFARNLIVQGTTADEKIPIDSFLLDSNCKDLTSDFIFVIQLDKKCYEYGFKVSSEKIEEEWLKEIFSESEKELFTRKKDKFIFQSSNPNIDEILEEFTRSNQLLLKSSVEINLDKYRPIYNWFKSSLTIISPISEYVDKENFVRNSTNFLSSFLQYLDTGIERVEYNEKPLSDKIPEELTRNLSTLKENEYRSIYDESSNFLYRVIKREGKILIVDISYVHIDKDGKAISFEEDRESDGTKRLFDLLPAFRYLLDKKQSVVFIIDELDRRLHSMLTKTLISSYLNTIDNDFKSQLIFTTHDVLLMDQELFRRDEMWMTQRNHESSSELYSIAEFKNVRNDKLIQKSYLQGRFGGIPRILMTDTFQAKKIETVIE